MIGLMWFRFNVERHRHRRGDPVAIPGRQSETFNTCTQLFHEGGGGPYDAAAVFMLGQLNKMDSADPAPDSDEAAHIWRPQKRFGRHCRNAKTPPQ